VVAHRPNDLCTLRTKYCVVLDSSQSNNASWNAMKEILQTKLPWKASIRKHLNRINTPDVWSLEAKCYSECWKLDNMSLFLKDLPFWISGRDSFKGEGCNTTGVCRSLSSGFELKHDRLCGDDNVKVNLWRWAWPKVGCCTIALHIGPISNYMLG
jgi:hypothetical protein